MLEKFLEQLSLTNKESKVYLALLAIGQNAVSVIAKHSGLTRTTTYDVLHSLKQKGFISELPKNNRLYYSAQPPEVIGNLLDQQIQEKQLQKTQFNKMLPELNSLKNRSATLPTVRYFEGLDGIIQIYEHTLKQSNDKLAYSCAPDVTNPDLKKYLNQYTRRRAKAGLKARAIFPNTQESQTYLNQKQKYLLDGRLVPQDKFPFKSEINIYGDFIAYISITGNLHGVILHSAEIAATERSIFELAWLGATSSPQYNG